MIIEFIFVTTVILIALLVCSYYWYMRGFNDGVLESLHAAQRIFKRIAHEKTEGRAIANDKKKLHSK